MFSLIDLSLVRVILLKCNPQCSIIIDQQFELKLQIVITLELSKVVEEREQRLIARRSLTSPEQKDLDELDEKYFIIHKNTN